MSRLKSFDLILLVVLNLLAAVIIYGDMQIPVVRPLLTIFMFGSLGYTIVNAWAPELSVQGPVVILMTLVLSLVVTALVGLGLHYTPLGMTVRSWSTVTAAIIFFHVGIMVLRRAAQPYITVPNWNTNFSRNQAAMLVLAVGMVGAALMISRSGELNQPVALYTQLWMLPENNPNRVELGIKNQEGQNVTYHLVLKQGETVAQDFPPIDIAQGQDWRTTLDLSLLSIPISSDNPVEAVLYRMDNPDEIYRTVSLK